MYDKKMVEEVRARRKKWEETTLKDTVCKSPKERKSLISSPSKPVERLNTQITYARLHGLPRGRGPRCPFICLLPHDETGHPASYGTD